MPLHCAMVMLNVCTDGFEYRMRKFSTDVEANAWLDRQFATFGPAISLSDVFAIEEEEQDD